MALFTGVGMFIVILIGMALVSCLLGILTNAIFDTADNYWFLTWSSSIAVSAIIVTLIVML